MGTFYALETRNERLFNDCICTVYVLDLGDYRLYVRRTFLGAHALVVERILSKTKLIGKTTRKGRLFFVTSLNPPKGGT